MPLTIVLADDHHVVRQGLQTVLRAEGTFQLVGEAARGDETVRLVAEKKPDVLVLDLTMPEMNGLEVTARVRLLSPKTQIVILSMHDNVAYVAKALRAGASAYVLKESATEVVVHAIREAAAGRRFLGPPLSHEAVATYERQAEPDSLDLYDTLTNREREVLQLTAEGLSSSEVGRRLHISPRTVESHRANLMRKLALANQSELVRFAVKRGIVSL